MRKPSPTTVIACAALFFSLTGAGLAASRYLITSVSQIKPSVRHALRGQTGPQGLPGAPGATGAIGPQGLTGNVADGTYASASGASLCRPAQPNVSCNPDADVVVRCNLGDHVLQGGYYGTGEVVTVSQLIGETVVNGVKLGRGWEVIAHLDRGISSGSVEANVLCVA